MRKLSNRNRGPTSDEEIADAPVEALPGSIQSGGDTSEIAGGLLEMLAGATKLAVLVAELDEDEFKAIERRLAAFLGVVEQIPRGPRKKRRIGFKPRVRPTK